MNFKKVSLFNYNIRQSFAGIVSIFATMATLYALFGKIPDEVQKHIGIIFIILLIVIYFALWIKANFTKKAHFKINDTNINILPGDIFKQKGLKIIGVNDFFDTIADDKIIAKTTLHGIFLDKYKDFIDDLDYKISNSELLNKFIVEDNVNRSPGKSIRYKVGSLFEYDNYILTAFTKFNEDNEAWLSAEEYIGFWMQFWQNINTVYAGRTISIPLMGAGITRYKNGKPSKQQLLEIMLWTLKISGFQCTYNDTCINFIIYPADVNEINFYRIKKGIF